MKMAIGVPADRGVTTPDVAAIQADAQMNRTGAFANAVLADARAVRCHVLAGRLKMRARSLGVLGSDDRSVSQLV